ncbi:MAG: autotransporter assembly complex protein TamA, partial [Endozoicomonas sp.]
MTAQQCQCQPSQQTAFRLSWLCRLWLLLFSLGADSANGEPLSFKVNGLDKPLAKNVTLYLETLPEIKPAQLKWLRPDIEETVRKGLMALGYYSPSVNMVLDERNSHQLNIVVDSGPPVRVRTLKVDLTGDASEDRAFKRLLKKQPLKEGDVMNDGQYESLKTQLNDLALARGYFDSQLTQHQVRVYPEQKAADIYLALNAGNRYAFGDIHYDDVSPATRQLLAPLINFRKGEPFQSVKLSQLNRDFSSTGYFSQIDVRPLTGKAKGNSVPIFIHVVPKTDWEVETGIGFSTDEGPRVSLSLDRPWMNERGHSLSSDLKVSTKVV